MRIAISAGHNVYNGKYFDCGAVCYPYVEADITKETVKKLIPLLKAQGHIVIDVTPYNERFKAKKDHHIVRCKRVDEFNADIYLDIHINAGGGTGVEIWVHNMNSRSVPYANKIINNIHTKTGLKNRGVKAKPSYWSVSLTNKPAMIIEGGFVDNKSDMDKLTPEKYAKSIAECFGKVEKANHEGENKLDKIKISLHEKELEVEGIYHENTNYIPIRFLEKLGYKIDWKNGKVTIDYKEEKL